MNVPTYQRINLSWSLNAAVYGFVITGLIGLLFVIWQPDVGSIESTFGKLEERSKGIEHQLDLLTLNSRNPIRDYGPGYYGYAPAVAYGPAAYGPTAAPGAAAAPTPPAPEPIESPATSDDYSSAPLTGDGQIVYTFLRRKETIKAIEVLESIAPIENQARAAVYSLARWRKDHKEDVVIDNWTFANFVLVS